MDEFFVEGGEYTDMTFTRLRDNAKLEVYGPFPTYSAAYTKWRAITMQYVDDCQRRYIIRELGS